MLFVAILLFKQLIFFRQVMTCQVFCSNAKQSRAARERIGSKKTQPDLDFKCEERKVSKFRFFRKVSWV